MKKLLLIISILAANFGNAQTKLTHSTQENVWASNSAACTTSGPGTIHNNSFIRVFDTDDFNVQDTIFFLYIELGVESTTGGAYDLYGRVHELNGTLLFANMSLIAADTAGVFPDSGIYKMYIPMKDGYALPGDTLVTEVFAPINGVVTFYPGSNPYLETDESYIAAAGCGLLEPSTYSSIGFTTTHLILHLWVNHKPNMNDIALSVFKDNVLDLNKSDFDLAMNDYDTDTVDMIQILTLPANGIIENNGTALAIGDTVWSNELDLMSYTPNVGYFGADDFDFRVRDNSHWSNDTTKLNVTIINWQLSLTENEKSNFIIYPNPANSFVEIKTSEKINAISVYSESGRLVDIYTGTSKTIDVSDYSNGFYFIVLTTDSGILVQKLIKE